MLDANTKKYVKNFVTKVVTTLRLNLMCQECRKSLMKKGVKDSFVSL